MTQNLVKVIFVILHIITAAGWFGLGLRLSGQARRIAAMEPVAAIPFLEDRVKTVRLMGIFILLTFVFGFVALFAGGGFMVYGAAYHTSILLIGILILIHYVLIGPSWTGLRTAFKDESPSARDRADSYVKRLSIGMGIGHLIWLVVLILMFWNTIAVSI